MKPEFWVSEQIAECTLFARLTFIGMWNFCDDQGVHPAKPKTLKAELYPMDDITVQQVSEWVGELIRVGLVREFADVTTGAPFWHVTGWDRHQKIDRPSHKHPTPPAADSTITRRTSFVEHSSNGSRTIDEAHPPETRGVETMGMDGCSPMARTPAQTNRPKKHAMPADFGISPRVQAWADEKGHDHLAEHLESFKAKSAANGYSYADWDAAFMNAIRDDWAKLREGRPPNAPQFQNRRSQQPNTDEAFT